MHSPSSLVRVGSVPWPSSTPHSISRPNTAASTTTLGSCSRAASMAASSAAGSDTLVMPMLDPARAGLTNTGQDRPCTASIAAALSRSHSLSVITVYGPTGSPAEPSSTFITCLSIITADAVTPDPTYLTSARSSRPWMVPSSPNGPCSSGKTTSTSPRVRGGEPGLVRDEGAVGGAGRHDDAGRVGVDLGHVAGRQAKRAAGRRAPAPSGRPWRCPPAPRRSGRGRAPRARWRPWRTTPRARTSGPRRPGPPWCGRSRSRRRSGRGGARRCSSPASLVAGRDGLRAPAHGRTRAASAAAPGIP